MKSKGSVTVFISLSIVLIMSLVFSLVEVVHFTGTKGMTDMVSDIGIESGFADFNRMLFERYGVLGVDGGYGNASLNLGKFESRMMSYVTENINPVKEDTLADKGREAFALAKGDKYAGGLSFLRASPVAVEVLSYKTLTDSGGAAFIKEAAKDVAYSIPDSLLSKWQDIDSVLEEGSLDSTQVEDLLAQSNTAIKDGGGETEGEAPPLESPLSSSQQAQLEANGNPIDAILAFKANAILAQVIGDVGSISTKSISADCPSKRAISTWETTGSVTVSATEKIFYGQYLKEKFQNYLENKGHEGLSYEWEYVLNGKDTDLRNLEATVEKLLALREVQNLAAIAADAGMQSEALGIATAICAAIAMPALIEPVKWGVIAAWAYLESVLDVRLLLNGGKVPLVKTQADWTSNILLFPNYIPTSVMARDSGNGLNYQDYLLSMTLLSSTKNLGLRSLDVVEATLHTNEDYAGVRMENFIYEARVSFMYEVNPIFASVTPMLSGKLDIYEFESVKELSYL